MGSRREWFQRVVAAGLGTLSEHSQAQPRLEAPPFQLGVASGMPTTDGVVLWTRLLPLNAMRNAWADEIVDVRWELAEDESFKRIVRQGVAQALPLLAHSVHVEIDGLPAGQWFHYRFMVGGAISPTGRTRTLPPAGQAVERFRLAFASCQRLASGHFGAYRRLLDEDADLLAFLGDYIYDSGAYPSPTVPQGIAPATTLAGYRAHHELHKRSPELQAAHAAMPWLLVWDDHEVLNDYAGAPARGLAGGRLARQRRAAYQAYYEHMPLRLASLLRGIEGLTRGGEELRIFGSLSWGRLASLQLLDCRQYRDEQACSGLRGLVDPADCAALSDPRRSMLGAAQEAWLERQLAEQRRGRGRPWSLLLQSTMFSPRRLPILGGLRIWNDGWDGYPEARARLVDALLRHEVAGPVLLGGDLHENWACNVPAGAGDSAADRRCVASEFVGTGITMSSFAPGAIAEIKAANPHAVYADAGRCGYGLLDLRSDRLHLAFRVVDSLSTADPAISTAAAFDVESGSPLIHPA
jgi:alkaline phosphatase D